MVILAQIVILILAISVQALVGSSNNTNALAANMAIRQDLLNQTDRAIVEAATTFNSGSLNTTNSRTNDDPTSNYSSIKLDTNASGIPKDLLNMPAAKYTRTPIQDTANGFTIVYIVERLCDATGEPSKAKCLYGFETLKDQGGTANVKRPDPPFAPSYRISIKIESISDNPKMQQFTQAIFSS